MVALVVLTSVFRYADSIKSPIHMTKTAAACIARSFFLYKTNRRHRHNAKLSLHQGADVVINL